MGVGVEVGVRVGAVAKPCPMGADSAVIHCCGVSLGAGCKGPDTADTHPLSQGLGMSLWGGC